MVQLLQNFMSIMVESSNIVVDSWTKRIESEGGVVDINVDEDMRSFSGDVISKACFGSNYAKGEEIFLKLRALQGAMSKKALSSGIPILRYTALQLQFFILKFIKKFST